MSTKLIQITIQIAYGIQYSHNIHENDVLYYLVLLIYNSNTVNSAKHYVFLQYYDSYIHPVILYPNPHPEGLAILCRDKGGLVAKIHYINKRKIRTVKKFSKIFKCEYIPLYSV
jgi:hypothetical protein